MQKDRVLVKKKEEFEKNQDLVSIAAPSGDSFHSSALYLELQSWCQSSGLEPVVRKKKLVNIGVE